ALRGKTLEFRAMIHEVVADKEARIAEIKQTLEEHYEMEVSEKETLYKEVEHLEKEVYDDTQTVLDDILPEAFAVMKETARRFKDNETVEVTATDLDREIAARRECVTIDGDKAIYQTSWMAGGNMVKWDMCHFDVQLMGGAVLHQGKIAEMATGEGKTLVATLPVYLNALPGKGVHVVTVNDYLARRDSEWMGLLYEFLGLTVDCIDKHKPNTPERKKAYDADITYGTNNEFGFDYLRDNMARNLTELVQRPHNYAIVDEVDSVLIDDARTPLIISGPTPRGDQQEFDKYKPIVEKLYNAQKALISEILPQAKRMVTENPDIKPEELGAQLLLRCQRGLPKNKAFIKFLSEPNIKNILQRTEGFYMAEQNRNMFIIDNDLTQLDDELNEKIHKINKKSDNLNFVIDQYVALDEEGKQSQFDNFKKEAASVRKELDHLLADTKKQLSQTIDMEDPGKFGKSLANIAVLYRNIAIIDELLNTPAADNFADYRDMMASTVKAEVERTDHIDRKRYLNEMVEIIAHSAPATGDRLADLKEITFGKYGLHFVIEEKLNTVTIMEKGIEAVSRNAEEAKLFVLPEVGTELAQLEQENLDPKEKAARKSEILRNFAVASERAHTVQQLLKAYTMFEKDIEYVIMDNKVKIVDEQTGRIMEGRRYSDGMHQAIEAKENVKVEAATQTYATITLQNYFRMYKKLSGMTGTAETESGEFWNIYKLEVVVIKTNKPIARIDMEDKVYKTKREKYDAVVKEIIELHEQGRPVLVGTTSVEDSELLSKILKLRHIEHNVLNAKLHQKEADIVAEAGQPGTVTISTNMAGRGTDIKLGPGVKEMGGLAIIGTERHDSRRVDRQLRGRAGRQGDEGSSQFYVSLEDNLMRLFGSERIASVMDRLGLQDGEVIQHSMISKSIERAQKKVEENNFGIRKRLLEYDDVMNSQRDTIYRKRRNALFGDRLPIDLAQIFEDVCTSIVQDNWEAKDYEGFKEELLTVCGCESPYANDNDFLEGRPEKMAEEICALVKENYQARMDSLCEKIYPIVERVYLNEGHRFINIALPITDGVKMLNVVAPLKYCYETKNYGIKLSIEKSMTLAAIDDAWKEHLRDLDDLKTEVQNASYEHKDPLLIYKLESFGLFDALIHRINREIVSFLTKGALPEFQQQPEIKEAKLPESDAKKLQTGRNEVGNGRQVTQGGKGSAPIHVEKKVGRNDPCPCGSGKKYKNCHGREE
ncbi:MAG: SEC-C domain-containing protein, partial [Bacteroidales bacterium]|nr:SEC-C domain-containing protein [Bacteroidales bacterium]